MFGKILSQNNVLKSFTQQVFIILLFWNTFDNYFMFVAFTLHEDTVSCVVVLGWGLTWGGDLSWSDHPASSCNRTCFRPQKTWKPTSRFFFGALLKKKKIIISTRSRKSSLVRIYGWYLSTSSSYPYNHNRYNL